MFSAASTEAHEARENAAHAKWAHEAGIEAGERELAGVLGKIAVLEKEVARIDEHITPEDFQLRIIHEEKLHIRERLQGHAGLIQSNLKQARKKKL